MKQDKELIPVSNIFSLLDKPGEFIYDPNSRNIYEYNGTYFKELDKYELYKKIYQLVGGNTPPYLVNAVVEFAKSSWINSNLDIEQNYDIVNFKNGTYDVKRKILRPHSPKDLCFYRLESNFPDDYSLACPRFMAFLDEISDGNKDLIESLQLMCGYTIDRSFRMELFFLLHGTGGNGKSVLLYLLEKIIGRNNISLLSPSELTERFDKSQLKGKVLNISNEINSILPGMSLLKNLSSGGLIYADIKHGKGVVFKCTTKFILTANQTCALEDTIASDRRLRIINFPKTFKDKEADIFLKEKLETELPAILLWMIEGLHKLREMGSFPKYKHIETIVNDFKQSHDSVARFLEDECQIDTEFAIPSSTIYADYTTYCKENGVKTKDIVENNIFGKKLPEISKGVITKSRRTVDGKRTYFFSGVATSSYLKKQSSPHYREPLDKKSYMNSGYSGDPFTRN